MKNRKVFEGYNQFQSGWVSAVKHFVTDPGVTILTAAVMHSQALNESKLNPWVAAQKDGFVTAHCHCMAGLCSFTPFLHLFFYGEKIILKYIIMHVIPPKQEECYTYSFQL